MATPERKVGAGADAGDPEKAFSSPPSVKDKAKWLQEAFKKKTDTHRTSVQDLMGSHIVSDRMRWFSEEAFHKEMQERNIEITSDNVVEERARWLEEQEKKNRERELELLRTQRSQPKSPKSVVAPVREEEDSADSGATTPEDCEAALAAEIGDAKDSEEESAGQDGEELAGQDGAATINLTREGDVNLEAPDEARVEAEDAAPKEGDGEGQNKEDEEKKESGDSAVASAENNAGSEATDEAKDAASDEAEAGERGPNNLKKAMPCLFSSPVFAQQRDQMEFYLPLACSCPDCRRNVSSSGSAEDLMALKHILRPWQVAFLASEDITTANQLVVAEKSDRQALCKKMKRWRKEQMEKKHKKISCVMALHIWSRTAEDMLKSVDEEKPGGGSPSAVIV